MAYQALYRKWRPRTFDAVIGQSAITDTLKNAIKRDKISHAFLFSGPRGTGKTSCAKIFAKALNCTDLQDGEPCNKCENCLAADNGIMNDIIEIDAASNNGVDEIREIRDKVKYAPTQGKFKVYIIDEVHMLSMGAFNALLKTLEEPPEHVVFILATTELQKVPSTIISRTQRYNFKRITVTDLIERMKYILEQENITFDDKALSVVAHVADGGMRDSLSILDQILSYDQDKVEYEDTLKITGFADQKKTEQLFINLISKDTNNALLHVNELLINGASSKNILDELIQLSVKSMLLVKGNQTEQFISEDFVEQVKSVSQDRFYQIVNYANIAINDLRFTSPQRIPLEIFIVQVTNLDDAIEKQNVDSNINSEVIKQLQQKINLLEQKYSKLTVTTHNAETKTKEFSGHIEKQKDLKSESIEVAKKEEVEKTKPKKRGKITTASQDNNRRQVYHVLENATKQDIVDIKDIWPDLMSTLEVSQRAVIEVLDPVAASCNQVVLKCKYELWFERAAQDNDLVGQLEDKIEQLTKNHYDIVLVADSSWLQVRKDFVTSHKKTLLAKKLKKSETKENSNEVAATDLENGESDQVIDKAKELFGDLAQIKEEKKEK